MMGRRVNGTTRGRRRGTATRGFHSTDQPRPEGDLLPRQRDPPQRALLQRCSRPRPAAAPRIQYRPGPSGSKAMKDGKRPFSACSVRSKEPMPPVSTPTAAALRRPRAGRHHSSREAAAACPANPASWIPFSIRQRGSREKERAKKNDARRPEPDHDRLSSGNQDEGRDGYPRCQERQQSARPEQRGGAGQPSGGPDQARLLAGQNR